MRGTVISNPKDSPCRPIRLLLHYQVHQLVVGFYSRCFLADSEELGSVDIPSGEICQRTFSFIFELHSPWLMRHGTCTDGLPVTGLDTSLFVGTDHVFIRPQGNSLENSEIEVQDTNGLLCEERVSREKPAMMHPRLDGITMEKTPDCGNAYGYHNASNHCLPGDIGVTETRKGKAQCGGEFTGQSLDLHNVHRGKKSAVCRTWVDPQDRPAVRHRTVSAIW